MSAAQRPARPRRAPWGLASILAMACLPVGLAAGCFFGHPPRWLLWSYPVGSVLSFFAYAVDKSAARQGRWRISEKTLHWLGLLSGWPGALLAQQLLRHKSSKAQFRAVFWCSVVLNILAFIFLASPYGQALAGS